MDDNANYICKNVCKICGKEAVIFRKHEGRALCRRHFLDSLDSLFRKNVRHSAALVRGASVAVEADAGNSSLFLMYEMSKLCAARKDLKVIYFMIRRGDDSDDCRIHNVRNVIGDDAELRVVELEYGMEKDAGCDDARLARRAEEMNALSGAAENAGIGRLFIADTLDDIALDVVCLYFGKIGYADSIRKYSETHTIDIIRPLENIQNHEIDKYLELKSIRSNMADGNNVVSNAMVRNEKRCFSDCIDCILDELEERHAGLKFNILKSRDKLGLISNR